MNFSYVEFTGIKRYKQNISIGPLAVFFCKGEKSLKRIKKIKWTNSFSTSQKMWKLNSNVLKQKGIIYVVTEHRKFQD